MYSLRCFPSSIVSSSSRCRGLFSPLVLIAVVTLALVLSSSEAEAQRRGRSGAAAAAARKRAMIASIQSRLTAARQLLAAAENQTQMSQGEVNQAVSKLSEIRTSLESDEQEAAEAAKSLHEIEDAVLDKSSEFRLLEQALDTAKDDLHAVVHKVIKRLGKHADVADDTCRMADMAQLSNEERKRLEEDKDYQKAVELMEAQARKVTQLRQKLFQADPQWVAVRKEAADATRKARQERAQASATGIGSLDDRRNLRTAKGIAADARVAIAECEVLLQRLGAKPAAPPKTTGSTGK